MNIREKILIVEDEKSIAHFISTILNSNDYETLLARSGSEAKTMISSHCPDLVILDLGLNLVGMGRGKVDLVDGRHNVQIGVHGERRVGDGLCLDTLSGVDDEHRALTSGQRTRDLVGKVYMARRIDEVELIRLAVVGVIGHADGVGLDRDAALALDIHGVEQLRLHVALLDGTRELEDAIADGGLPVIDMGDDREVSDVRGI